MQKSFTRSLGKHGTLQIHDGKAAIHNASSNPTFTFPTSTIFQALSEYIQERDYSATKIAVHAYIKRALVNGVEIIPRIAEDNVTSYLTAIRGHEAGGYLEINVAEHPCKKYKNIILYRI